MIRHENWAVRLDAFIEENRHRKFERGFFDCALFAGLALEAITDAKMTDDYVGLYNSKKAAFDLLKARGMNSLIEVANKHLGSELESVNFAGRGDIVAVKYEDEVALAVVDLTGRYAVTTGKDGLIFFERKHWLKAWGV